MGHFNQYFGEHGNYGCMFAIKTHVDGTIFMELSNHAYGETTGTVTVYNPSLSALRQLGEKLIIFAITEEAKRGTEKGSSG